MVIRSPGKEAGNEEERGEGKIVREEIRKEMAASWKVFGEEFRGFIEEGIKKQSKELGEIINGLREKLKERERKWKETRREMSGRV